jgi:hypothetical protein
VLLKEKHDQVIHAIDSFIKEHKLTEEAFQQLQFVNQHWLQAVRAEGLHSAVDIKEHDLSHVFRMFTQNDPSVYAKTLSAKNKLSEEMLREKTSQVLTTLKSHSAQVVIDAFHHGFEGIKLPINLLLL